MSTTDAGIAGWMPSGLGIGSIYRYLALGSILVLTASYATVLRDIAIIVDDSSDVFATVLVSLLVATILAKLVAERTAMLLAAGLLVVGYGWYLAMSPGTIQTVIGSWDVLLNDAVSLLTGLSMVQIADAEVWAAGTAPAPVFLSWYLAVRGRYVGGAAVGSVALLALVLTGDVGAQTTLIGVLAAASAVGFGELDRRDGSFRQLDVLVVVIVLMLVFSLSVSVVPDGSGSPLALDSPGSLGGLENGGDADTVEGSLMNSPDQVQVQGSVDLSPSVRFTVESNEPANWRVGTYDTFTGDSWVRSGGRQSYDGPLRGPPGSTETLVQSYRVEAQTSAMPAANQPTEVRGGIADQTEVTANGGVVTSRTLLEGDSYGIRSERPDASPDQLRKAGTDYPSGIEDRYLQLPGDQPERVGQLTSDITANTDNPYDSAVAIEQYLEGEKDYSLDVDRPDGNIADGFLFEMNQGYCTYYATTMAVMLRSEGIPARMATGYSTGQSVGDDEYVVRGLNSHAWVEVYFPNEGWVTFDPTPGGPRDSTRSDRIEDERAAGNPQVDTNDSQNEPVEEEDPSGEDERSSEETLSQTPENASTDGLSGADAYQSQDDEPIVPLPSRETIVLSLVVLFGVAAGAHRAGYVDRAQRTAQLHWQGETGDPESDVERAFLRLELLLAGEHSDRDPAETHREYLTSVDDVDERVERVARIHERARYGGTITSDEAREAIQLVDELVAERSRLRRLFE
ncbi:DUF3488 and DUF4129 domain-containing transglutaminase family protein [Natronoarchaeum sp. GCM10025703]|uniref:transglutaminase TgpA family protein n=1 Tax=unclassified Natronoarchaeum TaxID=2620183 RepID=UPI0036184495